LYAGSSLDSLALEQLQQLLEYYRQQGDQDSCQLLANYLGHRFGNSWQQTHGEQAQSANLSLEEAYQILGLSPGASREQISKAHKRLMQKLHPDRGGNDYLAAKLNQAKDLLLREVA
jgi:DnaJ-domain-containing protein 1